MNPIISNVIAYLSIIFISFFLMNFLTSGLVIQFMKAKASRGKKALIMLRTVSGDRWTTGTFSEDELHYTNPQKIDKIITVKENQVKRIMNIPFLQIDDIKNAVMNPDFTTASGHDASNVDNLLTRALMAPSTQLEKFIKITMFLCVVILILLLAIGFLVFTIKTQQAPLQSTADQTLQTCTFIKNHILNQTGTVI